MSLSLVTIPFAVGLSVGDVVTLRGEKAAKALLTKQSQEDFEAKFQIRKENALKGNSVGGKYQCEKKFVSNSSMAYEMLKFNGKVGASIGVLKGELYVKYYQSNSQFHNGINFLIQASYESSPIINNVSDMNQLKFGKDFKQVNGDNGTHLIIGEKYVSRMAIILNIDIKGDKSNESLILDKAVVKLQALGWTAAKFTYDINKTVIDKEDVNDKMDVNYDARCFPLSMTSKNKVKYDKIINIIKTFKTDFQNNNINGLKNFNIGLERCLYDLLTDPSNFKINESCEYILLPINAAFALFDNINQYIKETIIYNKHLNKIYFIVKHFLEIVKTNAVMSSQLNQLIEQCNKVKSNIADNVNVGSFKERYNYLQGQSTNDEKMAIKKREKEIEKPLFCIDVILLQKQLDSVID